MLIRGLLWLALVTGSLGAQAVELMFTSSPSPERDSPWSGSAELGLSAASGNSHTQNLNGQLKLSYQLEDWENKFRLSTLQSREDGQSKANRSTAEVSTHYRIDERNYSFANGRLTHDAFSGYTYQASVAGGLGHQFWKAEQGHLSFEAGPGFRRSRLKNDLTNNNLIGFFKGDFVYKLTPNTRFEQELTMLGGKDNTEIEAQTGLRVRMTDTLALKVSHTVQYNSDVPLNKKSMDTFTAVNLVYDFLQ